MARVKNCCNLTGEAESRVMEVPVDMQKPAERKGMRRRALTVLKIAIAVVAIWWVLRGVSWYDAGELPAGTEINAVKFWSR